MKKVILYSAVALTVLSVFSCIKKDTGCPYTEQNFKAPQAESDKVKKYLDSMNINALKDSSGLYYLVQTAGSDTIKPEVCSVVSVYYKGALTNDSIFDKTNGTPASFRLGDLIPGWQKGIPHITAGGKMRLFVPPTLGYGSQDITQKDQLGNTKVLIPGNSILIFDIELLGVR